MVAGVSFSGHGSPGWSSRIGPILAHPPERNRPVPRCVTHPWTLPRRQRSAAASSRPWRSAAWWPRACSRPRRPSWSPTRPRRPRARRVWRAFSDCDALRDWYVDHTLDQVGPWGWGGRTVPMMLEDTVAHGRCAGAPRRRKAVSNGATGTNTQEAEVDEPDVAKTDGRIVVQLGTGDGWWSPTSPAADPRELASWQLPDRRVRRRAAARRRPRAADQAAPTALMGREGFFPTGTGGTAPSCTTSTSPIPPTLGSTARPPGPGSQLSMRQYGDTVRLVTTTRAARTCAFVQPRPGSVQRAPRPSRRTGRSSRSSSIEDWIPGLRVQRGLPPGEVVRARHGGRVDVPARRRRRTRPRWPSPVPAARSTPRPTGSTSPPPTGRAGPSRSTTPDTTHELRRRRTGLRPRTQHPRVRPRR